MNFKDKSIGASILKTFVFAVIICIFLGSYLLGFFKGYLEGKVKAQNEFMSFQIAKVITPNPNTTVTPSPLLTIGATKAPERDYVVLPKWGGPDLWKAVNDKRKMYGVNELNQRDELCTIASIRLNELLDLGTLDGHVGFSKLKDEREDLKWVFEKYSVIAEFLAVGGNTPEGTVALWDETLGHKKILTGGEYVWGCIYAQNTFSVAIAAY